MLKLSIPKHKRGILLALALLLTWECYIFSWSFSHFFTGDGLFYLSRRIASFERLIARLTSIDSRDNYRPLTYMIFSFLFYPLFGRHPWGYHLVALLFHLANTVLVFSLLRRLVASEWAALAGAFIFGAHSINFFVTFGVSFLPDFAYALFYVASLLAFLKSHRTGLKRWYVVSVSLFVLSLLTKESAVTLPFNLLLGVVLLLGAKRHVPEVCAVSAFKSTAPFFLILALYIAFYWTLKGGRLYPATSDHPYYVSFSTSVLVQKLWYIGWAFNLPFGPWLVRDHPTFMGAVQAALPAHLAERVGGLPDIFVHLPRAFWRTWLVISDKLPKSYLYDIETTLPILTAIALILFLYLVKANWQSKSILLYGSAFYLIALAPVLLLAYKTQRHNLYVPMVGFAILAASFADSGKAKKILACFLISMFAASIGGIWYYRQVAWPVTASRIAKKGLEAMLSAHPKLSPDTTLYFLKTGNKEFPWFYDAGNMFRAFYEDDSIKTLF